MTIANSPAKKFLQAIRLAAFAVPVLLLTVAWSDPANAVVTKGCTGTTSDGKLCQIMLPPAAGASSACFKEPESSIGPLRPRNEDAMTNNWACKCLTDIDKTTNTTNPKSWLINANAASDNPANYDYEAKLRANNTVQDYCKCRDTNTAGYCSCIYADKRTQSDCSEYRPPSYNYSKLQDPNTVVYKSIGECQATGHDFNYCNCRMNGGDNTRCLGILGTGSTYQINLANCQSNNSSMAPASLVLNYCTCVAAGNADAKCQDTSGYGAYIGKSAAGGMKAPDKKAADLTEAEKKALDAKGSAQPTGDVVDETGGTGGTGATGTTKEPARLFGLPSIVPACARAVSGEPPSLNCLMQVFGNIANLIIGITGSMALLMFVYGGSLMIWAAGDEGKVKKGKEVLTTAVTGIAIIMLSGYVVNYAMGKLGVTAPVQGGTCDVSSPKTIKMSANGGGIVVNVGGVDMCVHITTGCKELKGYACTDYRQRAAGKTDCLTNICDKDQYNICCPTAATPAK